MSVKTVCEDLFQFGYKQALKEGKPSEVLDKQIKRLEQIVHSMRLFQYLTLIAENLGLEPTQPGKDFSETFRRQLEEVLNTFYDRYGENLSDFDRDTFLRSLLGDAKLEIGLVEDYIEDLIILLLAFLVDKTLSEVYALTRIKNLVRERLGKNLPLL
ncbi:MAG TPA: hypothetical protein EYO62_04615 [Aquificales bacterium]|nr:hypothetical protein [Aquificales bacterium]